MNRRMTGDVSSMRLNNENDSIEWQRPARGGRVLTGSYVSPKPRSEAGENALEVALTVLQ